MSRELKFRAWDGETFYYVDLNDTEEMIEAVPGYLRKALEIKDKEFFTGLQDKHGVDIYEGDIVISHKQVYEEKPTENSVIFHYGCWKLEATKDIIMNKVPLFNYIPSEIEVIGNIHQHPTLLTAPSGDKMK